jgi:hypothetical protein
MLRFYPKILLHHRRVMRNRGRREIARTVGFIQSNALFDLSIRKNSAQRRPLAVADYRRYEPAPRWVKVGKV